MGFSWLGLGKVFGALDYSSKAHGLWGRKMPSRKGRARYMAALYDGLEVLESRLLLSTLPMPTITAHLSASASEGNLNTPAVAVDPLNPLFAVGVYTRNDPKLAPASTIIVEGTYTIDGGATWNVFNLPALLNDPSNADQNNLHTFAQATNASVAFDRTGNVYILDEQHTADYTAGAVVLFKYTEAAIQAGTTPALTPLANDIGIAGRGANDPAGAAGKVLYEWVPEGTSSEPVYQPMLTVDNNAPTFTDPDTAVTVNDPLSGTVYAAWGSQNIAPTGAKNFDPNAILVLGSSNGGTTFSAQNFVDTGGNYGAQRDTAPQLVVSQGTLALQVALTSTLVLPANGQLAASTFSLQLGAAAAVPLSWTPNPADTSAANLVTDLQTFLNGNGFAAVTVSQNAQTELVLTAASSTLNLTAMTGGMATLFGGGASATGVITQGSPAGQLSIVWDDWNSGSNAKPNPVDYLTSAAVTDGAAGATFGNINGSGTVITDAAGPSTFVTPATTVATGNGPISTATGNFTGGNTGVVVANQTDGTIVMYTGNGAGVLTPATTVPGLTGVYYVAAGDFNGDNISDVAFLDTANPNQVGVMFGSASGTFGAPVYYNCGATTAASTIAVGTKVGVSGKPDIVVSNPGAGTVSVLLNSGTGTFAAPLTLTDSAAPSSVVMADFDNDGKTDIAVATAAGIDVFRNTGAGTFAAAATFLSGTIGPLAVGSFGSTNAIAYVNGTTVAVLPNTSTAGTISFGAPTGGTVLTFTGSALVAGNFDSDGNTDLFVANPAGANGALLLGKGDGTFQSTVNVAAGNGQAALAVSAGLVTAMAPRAAVVVVNPTAKKLTLLLPNATASVPATTTSTLAVGAADAQWTQLANAVNATNQMVNINNLEVTVALQHAATNELKVVLTAPDGIHSITLVSNRTNADGTTNANTGTVGANYGTTSMGELLGTVFDDRAPRAINDANAQNTSYTGHFSAEGGTLLAFLESLNGGALPTAAQLTGNWVLSVTDYVHEANAPTQHLYGFALRFSAALTAPVANNNVASYVANGTIYPGTLVRGAENSPFPDITLAEPDQGVGPSFSVAQDNTLGSFSPYQGRLYVAFTGGSGNNTDIFLSTSDDGGATWTTRTTTTAAGAIAADPVNDDSAVLDGFSGSGRAQFMPSVAVDQTTGTLAVSFYDARYDAAQARVAQFFGTSLDGGRTFGQETYLNTPNAATDGITGTVVNLEPASDNQSAGNAARDTTFAFGSRQGLAVAAGHVFALWSGNENNGTLRILTATATIAAGPRIVTGDMGPVTADFTYTVPNSIANVVTYNTPGNVITYNNTFAADGTRQITGFVVVLDRPIDPAGFAPADVTVSFTAADATVTTVPDLTVNAVTALDAGTWGPSLVNMASTYLVTFTNPVSAVGSYSYAVGPAIHDKIRQTDATGAIVTATGNAMDQNSDATTGDAVNDLFAVPTPTAAGNGFDTATSPLIVPGPRVISMFVPGNPVTLTDNTLNGLGTGVTITLPATIDPTQYTPAQLTAAVLTIVGPSGTVLYDATNAVVMDAQGNLTGYSVTAPGLTPTTTLDVTFPTLQAGEVYPNGPYTVTVSSVLNPAANGGNGNGFNTDNLVLNNTVSTINVVFDRDMVAGSFTAADILRLSGPLGVISGPFTVTADPVGTPAALAARTFAISIPTQTLSGSYVLDLAAGMTSVAGQQMDANANAGLDQVFGNPTGGTTTVKYASSGPVTVGTDSLITIPDSFFIPAQTGSIDAPIVQLNITYANDPDLTAVLIAPDGTPITLFSHTGSNATNKANFSNTILDNTATVSIAAGAAPFFSHYTPAQSLDGLAGINVHGTWTLRITSSTGKTGTINSWNLTFQKPVSASDLGQLVADQTFGSFRIFTEDTALAQSSTQFTALGGASLNSGGNSGRIGGIAVDPSDPSGNTVYVGGASGGVWKTTDFLTTSTLGPTYIPITDLGPAFSLNIGSIAVFGRNNDPNQSILLVATGEGDTGTGGAGFLRSMDGGATWTVLDSTTNVDSSGNVLPMNAPLRDHQFVGMSAFQVVVDPTLSSQGGVVAYAAFSTGLWRTEDTGAHWTLLRAGDCTAVVLDPNSNYPDAVTGLKGNDQYIYAAFAGDGVYASPNQGQTWHEMLGGLGNPLVINTDSANSTSVPVVGGATPNGALGRIDLVKPFLTGDPSVDVAYQGWLYALVAQPSGHYNGLYLTKDFGENWTLVKTPNEANALSAQPTLEGSVNFAAIPTNDTTQGNLDIFGAQGNYDISLAIDPLNPNIVYLGGSADFSPAGEIRVDCTGLIDSHALFQSDTRPDGGLTFLNVNDGIKLNKTAPTLPTPTGMVGNYLNVYGPAYSNATDPGQWINFATIAQDPTNPFQSDSQIYVTNITQFGNSGAGATWTPFDTNTGIIDGSTDQHRVVTFVDPLTGKCRLIFGDDQGVWSGVDNGDGTINTGFQLAVDANGQPVANALTTNLPPMGVTPNQLGSRNGNLQVTQEYYGAAQPSQLAADLASAMFYGNSQDNGQVHSDPNILTNGNLNWTGPDGDGQGVAADQTGSGTSYWYNWPCCGGNNNAFFQVVAPGATAVGRTYGLIQQNNSGKTPDPQWPFLGGVNFEVNPINGNQMVISSTTGNIFLTANQGQFWQQIGDGATFANSNAYALAFGSPNPAYGVGAPQDNFIYAGTDAGHIYVTFDGGGANGNSWIDISSGLDGSGVRAISASPYRGSHAVFAVTSAGVYYMADSSAANATWTNITSNVFTLTQNPFQDASLQENKLGANTLNALAVDWRYHNLNNIDDQTGPVHPIVYVGGQGGVYRSIDPLDTTVRWSVYPNTTEGAVIDGGLLPNANITTLNLELGNIDPSTGLPIPGGGVNMLVVTTYGRGDFGIRIPDIVNTGPKLVFAQQPTDAVAGTAVAPAVVVDITDYQGNILTTDNSLVTLTIVSGPTGATLGGSVSVAAVNGVATFSNLTLPMIGAYALTATDPEVISTMAIAQAVSNSFNITPTPAAGMIFTTTAQVLTPGLASAPITVSLQDAFGNLAVAPVGGLTISLASSSLTGVFRDTNNTVLSTITIPAGSSTATFVYTDNTSGSPLLTVTAAGLPAATQQETVLAAPSQMIFTTTAQTLQAGVTSAALTVQLRDALNHLTTAGVGGLVISLRSTSTAGIFLDTNNNPITTVTILAGASTANFLYVDTTAGTPTLTAASAGLSAATQIETIQAAAVHQLVFTNTSQTLGVGTASNPMTVQLQDTYGNPVTAGAGGDVVNLTTSSGTGTFLNNGVIITSVTIPAGSSLATFTYKDMTPGTPTLTATAPALALVGTQAETVQAVASRMAFTTAAQVLTAGTTSTVLTIQLQDALGNPILAPTGGQVITLATTSTGGIFVDGSNNPITSVTVLAGTSSASFLYRDTVTGTPTISAAATGTALVVQQQETVRSTATRLMFTTATQTLVAGVLSSAITVQLQDAFGNAINAGVGGQIVSLTTTSLTGSFFDAGNNLVTSVTIPAGSAAVTFFYKDDATGTPTLTVTTPALTTATQAETVSTVASTVAFITAAQAIQTQHVSGVITVELLDAFGNAAGAGTNGLVLSLRTSSRGGTFLDSQNNPVSNITIAAGATTASFYYQDSVAGTPTLTVTMAGTLATATQQETLTTAVTAVTFTSASQTLTAGVISNAITMVVSDTSGNIGGRTIALATTSTGGAFYDAANNLLTSVTLPAGVTLETFTLYYKDTVAGLPYISATSAGLATAMQQETIVAAAATQIVFTTLPQSILSGTASSVITVKLEDVFGNGVYAPAIPRLSLSSSSTLGAFTDVNGNLITQVPLTASIPLPGSSGFQSWSQGSFLYKDSAGGSTATLTVSVAGLTAATQQETITPTVHQKYVIQLYHDVLNRTVDPAGLSSWTALLDNGTTYAAVATAITSSREYDSDVVDGFYVQYLGRHADPNGLNDWINLMQGGYNAENIRAGILGSPEYFADTGGTNTLFVTALYQAFLNRTPDAGGLSDWTTILNTNADTRQDVAARISNSDENRTVIITGFYQTYLHRAPDPAGLAAWKQLLANGITQPQIITAFVTAPEYFAINGIS